MSDILGYAASCAVLASFLMRTMVPLRLVAILSNVLFVTFGYVQNIHPILLLHMVLLPINSWRLVAALEAGNAQAQSRLARLASYTRVPDIDFVARRWSVGDVRELAGLYGCRQPAPRLRRGAAIAPARL